MISLRCMFQSVTKQWGYISNNKKEFDTTLPIAFTENMYAGTGLDRNVPEYLYAINLLSQNSIRIRTSATGIWGCNYWVVGR